MLNSAFWTDAISQIEANHEDWVMATVIATQGSTPRDSGTKMLITENNTYDTIGGGQFEFQVVAHARAMLNRFHDAPSNCIEEAKQAVINFPLAAKSNQCCGGQVNILLEYFSRRSQSLHIFGAGHVAQALVPILSELNYDIKWVDSRPDIFPDKKLYSQKVEKCIYENSIDHIRCMTRDSIALVLTHDHRLDYALICALLDRKDCQFIGLIGSKTKAMRFKRRLKSDSFTKSEIDHVHCPIGLDEIPGKRPIEIAISIAGQLIQHEHSKREKSSQIKSGSGIAWKKLRETLLNEQNEPSNNTLKETNITL